MKKSLFLLTFIILITSVCFAQDTEKKMSIGGSFGISSVSSFTIIDFNPEFGAFLNDNWAVGGRLRITSVDGTVSSAIVPYTRYKFLELGNFSFFGQAEFIIGLSNFDVYQLRVLPVITYPVYKNFGLVAALPSIITAGSIESEGVFGIDINSDLTPARIGITYKF